MGFVDNILTDSIIILTPDMLLEETVIFYSNLNIIQDNMFNRQHIDYKIDPRWNITLVYYRTIALLEITDLILQRYLNLFLSRYCERKLFN